MPAWMIAGSGNAMLGLIAFPAHALLIVEERLAEQEAEGVENARGRRAG